MRKFTVCILTACFALALCGCEKENPYLGYVSDLKTDVYVGNTDGVTVTAFYGFRENPFENDGKVGEKIYGYTFKLDIVPDDVRREIEFDNGKDLCRAAFTVDEITGEYKAFAETRNYFSKEFPVKLVCGSEKTDLLLVSELPDNCLTYEKALDVLSESQKPLLDAYKENGIFNAEIYMRIFIKNQKPYWYFGIASGNKRLKALLIDGVTGELLALREII